MFFGDTLDSIEDTLVDQNKNEIRLAKQLTKMEYSNNDNTDDMMDSLFREKITDHYECNVPLSEEETNSHDQIYSDTQPSINSEYGIDLSTNYDPDKSANYNIDLYNEKKYSLKKDYVLPKQVNIDTKETQPSNLYGILFAIALLAFVVYNLLK